MIVVCGEALIDMIQNGDGTQRAAPGGGPFNTARALARLGVPTAFLGHLSEDMFGRELAELLVADGASLELATVGSEPTTIARADVDNQGFAEYQFVVKNTSAPNLTPEMLPESFAGDVAALHIGTLGLVVEPMASTLFGLVQREHGRLIMLDPNIRVGLIDEAEYKDRLQTLIAASTIVKASDTDLSWLYPESDYEAAADRLLREGVRLSIVTLGAEGAFGVLAWLYDHDLVRPELSLDEGQLRSALEYACLAASLTCARGGADPPWKREMGQA
ncbi:MAG: carbohydrate kinase [Chloroflexi bacterium]|nr:MAG: carbohydrate kinase [Chloroflexota bacterium]